MKVSLTIQLVFLLLVSATSAQADKIILAADEWCPYNCNPESTQPGYIVDIARTIFEAAGHQIEYRKTNWARAVADAKDGKINGVIGAVPAEVPGFILPDQPLGISEDHFYTLANNPWRYTGIASLAHINLGVINGYAYTPEVLTYINSYKNSSALHVASGQNALQNNINMVIQHRLDAVIEDQNVFTLTSSQMGNFQQFIDAGATGNKNYVYIAFSPNNKNSKIYANLLEDGIIDLRANGKLKKILARYDAVDWIKNE